jgi:hypothetical protein
LASLCFFALRPSGCAAGVVRVNGVGDLSSDP